jgi:F0F1-type ATP synthase assembly protein I
MGLSPAGRASTILATEINVMTGLLMGYMTGKYTDTEPISDYLLYRGLLIKDDKGIRLV